MSLSFDTYSAERAKRRLPAEPPTKRELASIFRELADALDRNDEAGARRLIAYLAAEGFAFIAAVQRQEKLARPRPAPKTKPPHLCKGAAAENKKGSSMQNDDSNGPSLWQVAKEQLEQAAAEERLFWTCPATGRDCRHEPRPALAIIENREAGTTTLRMYANEVLADEETPHSIEVWSGISADYFLKKWLHYCAKAWVDAKGLDLAMSRIAWHFVAGFGGERSRANNG